MKYFIDSSGQLYIDPIEENYEDLTELGKEEFEELHKEVCELRGGGKSEEERIWRNSELSRADIELLKVQDGDGTGLVSDWRAYRVALRNYPQQEGFPNCERPKFINSDKE